MSGSPLPTTDGTASFVGKTVSQLFTDAIPVAEAAIIAADPFMATPVLEQVWEEAFSLIVTALANALGTEGAFVTMDFQSWSRLNAAATAVAQLKAAQASGDQNALSQANQAIDVAAGNLLHYGGDAHT